MNVRKARGELLQAGWETSGDAVFVGIGGNLPDPAIGPPRAVLSAAVRALSAAGIAVRRRSRWYRSAPVPTSDQPAYVNAVLQVAVAADPYALLQVLHGVEAAFGRVRGEANAPRILDLDLLAYGRAVIDEVRGLVLPHPRMHLRAFVLKPLAELAPHWRHPVLGRSTLELLATLPPGQLAEPLPDGDR